ncbi:MAG TPA: HIT domain-containing protein [Candidatus Pacearchaeota archaeon]|nr:HIT domain-containing protein [Candidatus Pacearchaeota archaeon]HPZ74523.1 HIT domain-containing protein [Candidatus Pacearchaeota archaeon]HQD89112.1 HIT domain-containing protein [Candidatus Pacearchaeota archaeon]
MKNCLFCNIVGGKTDTKILFENNFLAVFEDINPKAPLHLLIVPKKHIESLNDVEGNDWEVFLELFKTAQALARKYRTENGYKLHFNFGKKGGQEIDHMHLHLLGGF